jgi:SNF2 family DNA or RNA helicase
MGLGKTVQALAATELLRRSRGIVAPASVKYQLKNEIESSPAGTRAGCVAGVTP